MKEHKQSDLSAASVTEPGRGESITRFQGEFPALPVSFARTAVFAASQPDNVDLNEMLFRLRRREL